MKSTQSWTIRARIRRFNKKVARKGGRASIQASISTMMCMVSRQDCGLVRQQYARPKQKVEASIVSVYIHVCLHTYVQRMYTFLNVYTHMLSSASGKARRQPRHYASNISSFHLLLASSRASLAPKPPKTPMAHRIAVLGSKSYFGAASQ